MVKVVPRASYLKKYKGCSTTYMRSSVFTAIVYKNVNCLSFFFSQSS